MHVLFADAESGNVIPSGDANAKDQHGHDAGTVGFRKRQRTGNQFIKLGKNAPRDLEAKPLSEDEMQIRNLFTLRAKQKQLILADESLYDQYLALYKKALSDGQVKIYDTGMAMSFNDWLMTIKVDPQFLGD